MEKAIEIVTKKIHFLEDQATYWHGKMGKVENTKKENEQYNKAWSMYIQKITTLEETKKELERALYQ